MAYNLPFEMQCRIAHDLAECCSIRSIERKTGHHRDSIMRLGVRLGIGCAKIHDETMRNLPCKEIEIDEMWGYVGKKQKWVTDEEDAVGLGDCWTYVAVDPVSKVVPSFVVGKRNFSNTYKFGTDLASRMKNFVQISSDSMNAYISVVERAFGDRAAYAQIVKTYTHEKSAFGERKYSPPTITGVRKTAILGQPDPDRISTSHVEAQNMTMRNHSKRLARLTSGYSKKVENMRAAISLHFCYYNLCRSHSTIKMTPAMALGIMPSFWSIQDLVRLALEKCPIQNTLTA